PPTAPGTPVASGLTATGVTLTWPASTAGSSPIARYQVFRVGSPDTVVGTTANGTTATLALTGLTPSTAYTFYVVAQDGSGVSSGHSPSVAVTTPPAPAGNACQVTYSVSDWGAGFTATIAVKNSGTTAINGWTLTFGYTGNQTLTSGWSATWTQTGQNLTATSLSYNGALAPGASTSIGFNANYSGTN